MKRPGAPGMKYRHAPDKDVHGSARRLDASHHLGPRTIKPVGFDVDDLIIQHRLAGMDFVWSLGDNGATAAAKLFAGLRYFDDRKDVRTVLVAAMPSTPENSAYNNRLGKSSGIG